MQLLKKYWLFFAYLLSVGLLFTFLVPPFQKPDENRHYYQAQALSRGTFTCQFDENGQVATPLPKSVINFPETLKVSEIAHTPNLKFTPNLFQPNRYPLNDPVGTESTWCSYSVIGYLPNSLGLLLGRPGGSLLIEFYVSRFFALLLFFVAVYYALRLTPLSLRSFLLLFAALPMTVHQVTAISYDTLTLIMAPVAFASFTNLLSPSKSKHSLCIFLISLLLIVLSKPAYAPLLLLSFLVINFKEATLYLIFSALVVFPFLKPSIYIGLPSGVNGSIQQQIVLHDPLFLAKAIYKTITTDTQALYEGLIGYFGWLDYKLHYILYLLFPAVFSWLVLRPVKYKLTGYKLAWLFVVLFVTVLTIFASLYLIWTPVGADYVTGIQGRYFLIILPFFGLAVSLFIAYLRSHRLAKSIALVTAVFLLILHLALLVYHRYYDYSLTGFNDPVKPAKDGKVFVIERSHEFKLDLPSSHQKLAGFYFYQTGSSRPGQYRYDILSPDCKQTFYTGYLQSIYAVDVNELHIEHFPPFWVDVSTVCLRLERLDSQGPPLELRAINGSYIEPLYLITSLR